MEKYDDILKRMKLKYKELSGFLPNDESDIMLRLKVLAGEIFNSTQAMEFLKNQMFVSTASGEYLDKHALMRGLYRKDAAKAIGVVTFCTDTVALSDIVIEEGTVVATLDKEPKQFVTKETVTLKANTNNVKAIAEAVRGSSEYNVRKETIKVLVTPPAGITSVKNEAAFSGGVDAETDEELRKRVLDSYRDISNSTNEIYYKRLVESVPGVYSSSVIPQRRGIGTLDVFLCGKGSAKIERSHIDKAQELVDENRELNVDVFVLYATPRDVRFTIGIDVCDGYDFEQVSQKVKDNITEYVDSLGVSNSLLLSSVGDVIYHTEGVRNYLFYSGYCTDTYVQPNEYCVVKEIDIKEWR